MPSPSTAAAIRPPASAVRSVGSGKPSTRWVWLEPPWALVRRPPTQAASATTLGVPRGMPPKPASAARRTASTSMPPAAATTTLQPV